MKRATRQQQEIDRLEQIEALQCRVRELEKWIGDLMEINRQPWQMPLETLYSSVKPKPDGLK